MTVAHLEKYNSKGNGQLKPGSKARCAYIVNKDASSSELIARLCREANLKVMVTVRSFSDILKDLALRAADNKSLHGVIIIGPKSLEPDEYKILISTLTRFNFYRDLKCIAFIPHKEQALAAQLRDSRIHGILTMPTTREKFQDMVNTLMHNGHLGQKHEGGNYHSNGNKIKILMADDSIMNQELIKIYFKYLGFDADFAREGQEVIKMVQSETYDICFLDTAMKGINGIEIIKIIRHKISTEIPIIALLQAHNQHLVSQCQNAGANGHLYKPVDMIRLNEKIKTHVASSRDSA